MTGNAIKKTLEYHNISPQSIRHYDNTVIGYESNEVWRHQCW